MVGDLDDQAGRFVLRLLQPAGHIDVRAGVHDGVGDQFADDDQRVVRQPLGERVRFGGPGPILQGRTDETTRGTGRERAPGQCRAHHRAQVRAFGHRHIRGSGDGLPLRGNGPHGRLPEQLGRIRL